jgi:hypothetical protein
VVSARACANQFLPNSSESSGIALFDQRTVQADMCLNFEQIDTLFISVGIRKGVGGGAFWAGGPEFTRMCQEGVYIQRGLIFCIQVAATHSHLI